MTDVFGGDPPTLEVVPDQQDTLRVGGAWILDNAPALEGLVAGASKARWVDATGLQRMDSAGAMLLNRLLQRLQLGRDALRLAPSQQALMSYIDEVSAKPPQKKKKELGVVAALGRLGFSVQDSIVEIIALIGFMGLTLKTFLKVLTRPARFRLTPTVYHMEIVGLDAVPLVMLLSFLVGAVLAFLGANVLQAYGAQIYVVELVSYAFLREFGVLLTAIILAGRTASAFTAQIGAMQNREEIDAIRTLGLDPIELLVIPRLVALLVTLPLLTFIAMGSGILGGAVVSWLALDIPLDLYWSRLNQVIELRHFIVGIVKTPMFATIISLIGCLEGFQTQGTAQSVGERTTSAVVQCISLVIVLDAIAAVFFMEINL
ncbi:MAG TPA: ABC transporter permease [Xanthomonadaceae bacterium]|jgi:phospholipid/cholesterol/gamma-HCH transport system permease protein|nr:ABC transporter permease [Xanthomonadaceae bacterium]